MLSKKPAKTQPPFFSAMSPAIGAKLTNTTDWKTNSPLQTDSVSCPRIRSQREPDCGSSLKRTVAALRFCCRQSTDDKTGTNFSVPIFYWSVSALRGETGLGRFLRCQINGQVVTGMLGPQSRQHMLLRDMGVAPLAIEAFPRTFWTTRISAPKRSRRVATECSLVSVARPILFEPRKLRQLCWLSYTKHQSCWVRPGYANRLLRADVR
jgi:hypothetical protein